MIRITIELLPLGDESRKRHMGTAEIWNDATGTIAQGNYKYRLSKWGRPNSIWRAGEIGGFPRKSLGVWDLFFRALRDAVGSRNAN